MNLLSKNTVKFSPGIVAKAMTFKHTHKKKKLNMVDCIGYILARKHNLLFLTGDKEFESIPFVKFVK